MPAPARKHAGQRVTCQHHRCDQVDASDRRQLLVGEHRVGGGHLNTGVVHQEIKRTDRRFGLLYQSGGLLGVGQISEHHPRVYPEVSQLVLERFERLGVATRES